VKKKSEETSSPLKAKLLESL